ncbi:MAG: hypothetical protein ACTSUV_03965 [Candidatus Ranarchaeia archaeon]
MIKPTTEGFAGLKKEWLIVLIIVCIMLAVGAMWLISQVQFL